MQDTRKSEGEIKCFSTQKNKMGKLGKLDEFANLVVFLALQKADYITETTIQVNNRFVKGPL